MINVAIIMPFLSDIFWPPQGLVKESDVPAQLSRLCSRKCGEDTKIIAWIDFLGRGYKPQ